MERFKNIVVNIANEKAHEINSKIVSSFMKSFDMSEDQKIYPEIKKQLYDLIGELTFEVFYDSKSFIYLIERFSRDLFDILIRYRFGSIDRYNKFRESEEDFYSLAMFHEKKFADKPPYMQPFISIILAHNDNPQKSNVNTITLEEIIERLISIFNSKDKTRGIFDEDRQLLRPLAERIIENSLNLETIISFLTENLVLFGTGIDVLRNAALKKVGQAIENVMGLTQSDLTNALYSGEPERQKENYLKGLIGDLKKAETKEEIVEEINKDIEYLKSLLKGAVLNAIALEKPFASIFNKQLNFLINSISSSELDSFLTIHAPKIRYKEFTENENTRSNFENRRKIAEKIEEITKKI